MVPGEGGEGEGFPSALGVMVRTWGSFTLGNWCKTCLICKACLVSERFN